MARAACVVAQAQSSVTLYGKVDLGLQRAIGSSDTHMATGGDSRIGVRGVEDLGGGLKASKVLCNCMNVSQDKVCAGIERGLDLDGLKRELKCGTSCGSCVPEIKRLLATRVAAVAVQA